MYSNRVLLFIVAAMTLYLLTASISLTTPAMASSKGSRGGEGAVTQIAVLALVAASVYVTPVFALKRYFNCMTEIANKAGKLTLTDVNSCYDKEFRGSQGSSISTGS